MTKCLSALLFSMVFLPLWSQTPFFKSLSLSEVPNARIKLVYEGSNGIIWLGGPSGLFRFDGLEFEPFVKKDSTDSQVRAIYQDKTNRLWVGYEDGSIFYLQGKQLLRWMPEEGTPVVAITGFAEDKEGRLWFSTYGEGAYYLDAGRLYNIGVDDGLTGMEIYVMSVDRSGRVWLGTDGGISICSVANGKKKVETLTRKDGLPDEIVHEIIPDGQGNMWIGTYDEGVCRYHVETHRFDYPLKGWKHGIVNKLEIFEGKEVWIGTDGDGLWRFSLQDLQLRPVGFDKSTEKAKIYDLLKDVEGNIWVLSNTGGIRHANRQFEFLPTQMPNAQAMLSDADNRLWVGTPRGLFVQKNNPDGQVGFEPYRPDLNLNVISLYQDEFGNIWAGTFEKGVFCFHPGSGKMRQLTEQNGLTNNNVLSIDGVQGRIWLATLGGVSEVVNTDNPLDGGQPLFHNFGVEDGLGTNFIYKVFVDRQKRVWFGTDGQGISVLDRGNIFNYQTMAQPNAREQAEGNGLKAVYSLTEDHQGHIWVSTATQGIFEFDGKTFSRLSLKEGIRDLAITSLVTDEKGHVLIVHPKGIDLLIPKTHHLIYYDEEIGITDLDPDLNATCTDRWGNIWIGVKNGIVRFTPLREDLEIHPRTKIKSVTASLETVEHQTVVSFPYDQSSMVIEYMGLWYTHPGKVKYRYKLDGYDDDWIFSKDRQATYSRLPPGKYCFRVMSTENDAWSNEPETTYSFEIRPPVWKRWWFILLSLAMALGLFYAYLKARDRRLQRVYLLEREKAESELAAIKAQINPHFLFNSFNTLIAVIEEDPAAAVEYTEKLSDFFRMMIQLRDQELIPVEEDAELVRNYGFLLKKRYGDSFHLNLDLGDQKTGYILPLTMQILVENAVKHNIISKAKPLYVDIRMEGQDFVSVTNNLQLKIQPEKSTRFGLTSLSRRYEMMNGKKLVIEQSGAQFKVSVPVL